MAARRVLLQPVNFRGELRDFTYISRLEPTSSSFFTAFGISLLESLIRLKAFDSLTQDVWHCLENCMPVIHELSKKYSLQSLTINFAELICSLRKSARREAMTKLTEFIESSITSIDFSIRFILMNFTKNKSILKGNIGNHELLLTGLSKRLKIAVLLGFQTKYKLINPIEGYPIVSIYAVSQGSFAILYHRACKYIDEKPDPINIDPSQFPFTISKHADSGFLESSNATINLISFLASQLGTLSVIHQKQLKKKIEKASLENPAILSLTNLISLTEETICTHDNSNILSDCGKIHCGECIKNKEKCPCGVVISAFDRNPRAKSTGKYRSTYSTRFLETPSNSDKVVCWECKKALNAENYGLITCKNHSICVKCRCKKFSKGIQKCGVCNRDYTKEEALILSSVLSSLNSA